LIGCAKQQFAALVAATSWRYDRAPKAQEGLRMNKKVTWLVPCVATTVSLFVAHAVAQEASAPKPGPEHKRLGYFVGTWTTEGKMHPSEMGPGGKTTSVDRCTWFEGGFAVVCNSEGKSPLGPSKSIGILGYSPEEKVYIYSGVDSSGMAMTSVPRGTIKGDTWTYTDETMMGGKKMKSRVMIKEISPTEYTFRMDMQAPDGKWVTTMESKSTKSK
jgi:hypothetical protein